MRDDEDADAAWEMSAKVCVYLIVVSRSGVNWRAARCVRLAKVFREAGVGVVGGGLCAARGAKVFRKAFVELAELA